MPLTDPRQFDILPTIMRFRGRGDQMPFGQSRRRDFIALLGGAAIASMLWPPSPSAQQTARLRRIGVLLGVSPSDTEWLRRVASFTQALNLLGWTEGRNVAFEIRYAEGKLDRLPALVAELIQANVDIVVTQGSEPVQAARAVAEREPEAPARVAGSLEIPVSTLPCPESTPHPPR